ncbi:MAG TPA: ABC transporter substrate-binding protein [Firmicutes bacterium]|nr:ABC transporter substrate-binding protein [Bacillota bacterium]
MKKIFSIFCSIVFVSALLVGCGQDTNQSNGEDNPSTEKPTDPVAITILQEFNDGWVRNLNPFIADAYQVVQGFMYEPLVIFDTLNNSKETMWLAEDVISEPDNKTLTIKVRQGIKWSDGEEFNAEDVAFSYTIFKDHPTIDRGGMWGENGKLESVTIVDDYTVQIVMKEENRFHRNDVLYQRWIVPEHIWKDVEDPATYVMTDAVVTGAFSEVKSFTPEMMVFSRNPYYWKADELKIDELRVAQANSNDAALSLLQTGSIDWAHIFIPNIEDTYVKGDTHKKYWYGMNDAVRISFNYATKNEDNLKAFNDAEFKKAASMAVDRQGIIDSAVYGYLDSKVPANTGLPPALFGWENEEAMNTNVENTTYDLEAAKKVLADAGYVDVDNDGFVENPDGTKIAFEIVSPAGWSDWNAGAEMAAAGMREIGINATPKAIDLGLVIETWESGNHDALYGGYGLNSNIWKFYFDTIGDDSRVLTSTWWSVCQTNYVNDEINAMIAEMPTASDERLAEIVTYVEQYFAENMINIPVLYNGNWFVYNDSRFTGWATKDNPFVQPANCQHDTKILQLLALEPVE